MINTYVFRKFYDRKYRFLSVTYLEGELEKAIAPGGIFLGATPGFYIAHFMLMNNNIN
jgi:hypothetical protein